MIPWGAQLLILNYDANLELIWCFKKQDNLIPSQNSSGSVSNSSNWYTYIINCYWKTSFEI
jgi:hypothetical protein